MLRRLPLLAIALLASCASDEDHERGVGVAESALVDSDSVSVAATSSCTTASVKGLSVQLIQQIQCMRAGTFAPVEAASGIVLQSAVFPWLQTPARNALLAAQKQRGATMTVNSALRTLPQQLLLHRWSQAGRCGIGLAAKPGQSNHESGLAIDIEDNGGWRAALTAQGFTWLGASDPVHFDFAGEGTTDLSGLSVLAFQKLWNRNHPEDLIAEDSEYQSPTEERLAKSPVGGFAKGADCLSEGSAVAPPGHEGDPLLGASGSRRRPSDEAIDGCTFARPGAPTWTSLAWATLAVLALRRRRRVRSGESTLS